MQILFEKTHPKALVEALKLIHQTDDEQAFNLDYYDKTVDDSKLEQPVLLMFDYSSKGVDITTEELYKSGFKIFALKTKRTDKLNFFELSLTLMGLWSEVLKIAVQKQTPFIYTYKYRGRKIKPVK